MRLDVFYSKQESFVRIIRIIRTMRLSLEALQVLDAIDRKGSFAAAAEDLHRVPSAITYSVRQLEEALDVELFDRTRPPRGPDRGGPRTARRGTQAAPGRRRSRMPRAAGRQGLGVGAAHRAWTRSSASTSSSASSASSTSSNRERGCASRTRCSAARGTRSPRAARTSPSARRATRPRDATMRRARWAAWRWCSSPRPSIRSCREPRPLTDETIQKHRAVSVADTLAPAAAAHRRTALGPGRAHRAVARGQGRRARRRPRRGLPAALDRRARGARRAAAHPASRRRPARAASSSSRGARARKAARSNGS